MPDPLNPISASAGDTPGMSRQLSLTVPADAEQVAAATDAILTCLAGLKVGEEKSMAIALAVQEALANAVVHGCNNDPSKSVQCELSSDERGRVLIVVADPGPGFHFSAPPSAASENLYNDHGRGVTLIRQLMDEVRFERGGSVICMWKY